MTNTSFESLINNLKHLIFLAVPLSIAITYMGVFSFYLNFDIDISTYLGFEDLTIIYSKYTIASLIYLLILYFGIKKMFQEKDNSYWDKTIFKTSLKRRIIPMTIVIGIIFYIMYSNETLRVFIAIIIVSILMLSFIEFSIYNLFFDSKKYNKVENEQNLIGIMISLSFVVLLIPLSVGFHCKKIIQRESVILHIDNNKTIDAQKTSNLRFIGKTSSFVFILDSINDKTIVFPIDKINEIEYCNVK
ncbi:hypothetical protein BD847_3086 [Flavobacterium cutihirudinis]|uniref:Uncharacterized protein n=1 Tax=Flavobacterium cutihirudinis TaxID=1265740 RepID=A0A3D9FPY8_9FLAO|nr:hypothetical protein [Flavobacterium cutihirudinis]RED22457.1 hypothetical protein BD847_3086 [Flavobacterium cutihirudinis]